MKVSRQRAGARQRVSLMGLTGAIAVIVAGVTLVSGGTAYAHAAYVSSDPAVDAVLTAAPTTVTIKFAEPVNPSGSDIIVYGAKGNVVSGAARVTPSDLKTMTVPMQGDDSETYLVAWHTVSAVDGDPDVGGFVFHVDTTPGAQATATASAKASGTPSSGGSSGSSGGSGAPVWLVILVGVLGLAIGAGGASALRRRA